MQPISVIQEGDLLYVFQFDYIQTSTIQNLISIDCDNGVNWLLKHINVYCNNRFCNCDKCKCDFYKFYANTTKQMLFSNSLGEIEINAYRNLQ